jgi:glycosyltransferase involved in cell wall biosynthesis
MVTKNKLNYFKHGLEKLIANKKDDEEIIIGDGDSTDGTKEYLAELKRAEKIDDYISEPDFCESHALNKLFLIAKGELIKIINDDDVYYFPVINECKNFMLTHPEINIMGMEGGSYKNRTSEKLTLLQVAGYVENFKKWKENHTPFEFAVLGILFRRSSLPILGFWDLSFKNADAEYTFRATAGPAKLAWCLNPAFVFIRTLEGVTWNNLSRMKDEALRLRKFYLNENPPSVVMLEIKKTIREVIRIVTFQKNVKPKNFSTPWKELYAEGEEWLVEKNKGKSVEFLS